MAIKPASRIEKMPVYVFALIGKKIAALRAQGKDIIGLHIGSPDMPPPDHVIEALNRSAANARNHGYGGFAGTPGFRGAVAGYYNERFGVVVDPSTEVLPLIGSKEGIAHVSLAFLDPGDVALVPDPGYPTYAMGAALAGAESYAFTLDANNGFLPDLDSIPADIMQRARLMWVNYPNNPTGAVATVDDLAVLVEFAQAHDVLLCFDNPYADVTYDGFRAPSVLEVEGSREVSLEFNTLSKTYNMAGWRAGMCVGNAAALGALGKVKTNVDTGLFTGICDAGEAALRDTPRSWIEERNAVYQERRDLVMGVLPQIGLTAHSPKASLYVWARVDGGDAQAYTEGALEEADVAIAPGSAYGKNGEGHVRISLVTPRERLLEAMERLRVWYERRNTRKS